MTDPRLDPHYVFRGARGPSLAGLVGDAAVRLDPEGVRAAFGEAEVGEATCIAGASRVAAPAAAEGSPRPLHDLLEETCARIPAGPVALALSGGVDSAVLAALLRGRAVAYTLAPELPDYGEEDEASAVAARMGLELRRVRVGAAAYVDALPAAIAACECPLYNLHPVSRFLLARAVRADGLTTLVTGDGADERFGGTSGADYLPIVGALARAAGLQTRAPFLELPAALARDPDKRGLRALALGLGVPEPIALRPKRPRYAPPIDLACHWDAPRISALGRSLGRAPASTTDRERVRWTTLALLSRRFPGLVLPCVGSPD